MDDYTDKIDNINKNIDYLTGKIENIKKEERVVSKKISNNTIDFFFFFQELTDAMIEYFIDSIEIFSNNSIRIHFKYRDEFQYVLKHQTKEVSYGKKI